MYFCVHDYKLHESIKWLCRSGMQQQPGIVTHSRISSLLISRHLTRPRVASRYSVRTSSVTGSGCGNPKISGRVRAPVAEREAVFSPNPMRYRPIWSCDFRYNFTRPTIKSQGKSAPASNWFTVALANQSASRWNYTRLLPHGTS